MTENMSVPKPPTRREKFVHDLAPEKLENTLNECEPYIENGLRKIKGYYLTRFAFVKSRWMGKTIYQVYEKEFRTILNDEVIKKRSIKVNGKLAPSVKVILDQNYSIEGTTHFHEKPVNAILNNEIEVIHENEDILVINKPCSMPLHPCGSFRHNSLQFFLARKYKKLFFIIHRLDAITSGVVILGKTKKTLRKYNEALRSRDVAKMYYARVVGSFPDQEIICKRPIFTSVSKGAGTTDELGKFSETKFVKVFENVDQKNDKIISSVLKCYPKTGRTHQIRIHLQSLGFPIVNDPIYNSPSWGKCRFSDNKTKDFEQENVEKQGKDKKIVKKWKKSGNSGIPENCENLETSEILGEHKKSIESKIPAGIKLNKWEYTEEERLADLKIPNNVANGDISTRTCEMNGLCIFKGNEVESEMNSACSKRKNPGSDDVDGKPVAKIGKLDEKLDEPAKTGEAEGIKVEKTEPTSEKTETTPEKQEKLHSKHTFDPTCYGCNKPLPDPKPLDLILYLHSAEYTILNDTFTSKIPDWADKDKKYIMPQYYIEKYLSDYLELK